MNISVLTIRRPVLSIVLSTLIVLLGVVGFLFLGVRQFPDVDPPNITVNTNYPGANADVIESQITEPLEESINGIDGIRSLTSQSSDGRSSITVEFELGANLEAAANDVRDRVERAKRLLPQDVDPPVVAKADANSQAIIVMTLQSPQRSLNDLTAYANNVLKERLQTISGVGAITIWGERKYAMRIELDPARLAGYGLTTSDVRNALVRENVELPAGRLEGATTEMSLRTIGRLATPEEFGNLIVKSLPSSIVRLSDVSRIYLGAENERTILKRNGLPMIGMAISPQPGANQIDIAKEFTKRFSVIEKNAPKDIQFNMAFDNTKFIQRSIGEVEETLLIAFVLVVLIIFIFLRSWRATLIPVVAIPVSLISAFFFMWIAEFSINILTLLGIVLATGLVVDDAIVVMENIFRRIEEGESPREAAEKGSTDITFAIISTTITLAVVFIPIIFLPGLTGRLFREFGVVVAATVLVSAFVSLTLTPMMSSRLLKHHSGTNWLTRVTEPFFLWLNKVYASTLGWLMKAPWMSLIGMAAAIAIIVLLGAGIKSELAPLEDRSLVTVNVTAPEGTSFNKMDVIVDSLQERISRLVPENDLVLTVTAPNFSGGGANGGFARVMLTEPSQRTRSQMNISNLLSSTLKNNTEVRTAVIQEQTISTGGRASQPIQFILMSSELDNLRKILPRFLELAAKETETLTDVDVNLKFTKPEVTISIDRARARELGISIMDIADALQAGFAGQRYGYFEREGKQYQVIGEIEKSMRTTPDNLRDLHVRNASGELVSLANLVTLTEQSTPPQLYRYNRSVSATVGAGLAPGKTIADGIAVLDKISKQMLDESYSTALAGPARDFAESSSSLVYAFLLALIMVYLILAAQFESFVDPFTIMLTVPLALAGGVLSLFITGDTLNIFSEIGAIVLIGLVTKNGILIVEFANHKREEGLTWKEAVTEAAITRFRPILMTSLATILGALPIALALGEAAGSRVGLGVVIVGGMLLATFLTLYIIPALYVLLSKLKSKNAHSPQKAVKTIATAFLICMIAPFAAEAQQTLSLDDAVNTAVRNGFDIQAARQDSTIARLTGETANAAFLPTVNVNGSLITGANNVLQVTASGVNTERNNAGFTNINASAILQWTLFDGFGMFAQSKKFSALEQAGYQNATSRIALAVADVIGSYAAIVANTRAIAVSDTTITLATRRLDIITKSRDAGKVSGLEVSQAEIDLNTARAVRIEQATSVSNAKATLNSLLARDPLMAFVVDTSFTIPTLPPLDSLRALARQRNPETRREELRLEAASAFAQEMTSTLWPRIAGLAQYQYTNNTTDAGFILQNRSNGWSVGLNFNWNLFNGTADRVQMDMARADEAVQRITLASTQNDIDNRLVQAYALFIQSRDLMEIERSSYKAAVRNATIALEQLRQGIIRDIEARNYQETVVERGNRIQQLDYRMLLSATECMRLAGMLVR